MTEQADYQLTINTAQALEALKQINTNLEKLGQTGNAHFEKIGQGANLSGVKIGAVAGIVTGLTQEFINLGKQAVQALENAAKQSVALAADLESTGKIFQGVFQGNAEAGEAALERLRQASRKLGVDLTETGRAFIPEVGSLDQLERVAKLAAGLAASQPEQGSYGARVALQEALSGNLMSLQRRFELSPEAIKRIKNLQTEIGNTSGLIQGLEAELQRTGRDIDNLATTYQAGLGRMEQQGQRFGQAMGLPIIEELKQQFDALGGVLETRGDDFELIAAAVGDVVANIVDFVGSGLTDFLANLNTQKVIDIVNGFGSLVEKGRELSDVLGLAELPPKLLEDTKTLVEKLNEALDTAVKLTGLGQAENARLEAERAAIQAALPGGANALLAGATGAAGAAVTAGIPGASGVASDILSKEQAQIIKNLLPAEQRAIIDAAGQEAYVKSIQKTVDALSESAKREEELKRKQAERAAAQGKSTAAGEEAADAFLAQQQAAREAAAAQEEAAAAQDKITKATQDIEVNHQRAMAKIDQDFLRDRLKQEEDFADKRLDLAIKNAEKLEDIARDYDRDVAEAAIALGRDEEDIARKQARARTELERDSARERVKIEQTFRDKLREIRRDYEYDVEEATRNQDAIAFVEAIRRRDRAISEAKEERKQSVGEARQQGEEKRQELADKQQQELEDAKIKNQQKLEDLRRHLQEKYDGQEVAYQRELEQQDRAEQRKTDELYQKRTERQQEEEQRWSQAYEDLNRKYAAELELIAAWEAKKTEAVVAAEKDRQEKLAALRSDYSDSIYGVQMTQADRQRGQVGSDYSIYGPQVKRPTTSAASVIAAQIGAVFGRRARGGRAQAGQPYFVGEDGIEVFVPDNSGLIVPNRLMYSPPMGRGGGTSTITKGSNNIVNLAVEPGTLSPAQVAQAKQLVLDVLDKIEQDQG